MLKTAPRKYRLMHVVRWENEVGPIPEKMLLRCKTDDTLNTDPSNWSLITKAENANLNHRPKAEEQRTCHQCGNLFSPTHHTAKFCSKECYKMRNIEYNRIRRQLHKKEASENGNLSVKVRECVICGNAYFPTSNCQKTCSQACRTISVNLNHKKFRDARKQPVAEKHCSKCGQLFTPKNNSSTICAPCHEHKPRVVNCLNCGKQFTSVGQGVQLLCSDECRRQRKNKLRVQYGFHRQPARKVTCTCKVCGTKFEQRRGTRYCDECRTKVKAEQTRQFRQQAQKLPKLIVLANCAHCGNHFEKHHATKFCSDRCRNAARNASKEKYRRSIPRTDRIPRETKLRKRDRKAERELLETLPELNRNAPKNDREILAQKRIESPDHNQMQFRHYDKKLRITYYFSTEEKLNKHLKKLQDAS